MRQIFLDTETTGLSPEQGHRVIELAAVEVINRRITQQHFHYYLNPDREIDEGAQEVHGISLEFLQDKPHFEDIVQDFLAFISGAELVIHNAPFDVGFLNMELGRLGYAKVDTYVQGIVDTLKMAKDMRPGQRNNLDALCRHFGIDNSKRTLHGALLDAELLADVYMAMTRGQESLMMALDHGPSDEAQTSDIAVMATTKVLFADSHELEAHQQYLAGLAKSGACIWGAD